MQLWPVDQSGHVHLARQCCMVARSCLKLLWELWLWCKSIVRVLSILKYTWELWLWWEVDTKRHNCTSLIAALKVLKQLSMNNSIIDIDLTYTALIANRCIGSAHKQCDMFLTNIYIYIFSALLFTSQDYVSSAVLHIFVRFGALALFTDIPPLR